MVNIDEAGLFLDEISEKIPAEFFMYLNGGIVLAPEEKISDKALENDLFVLGEYHNNNIGRMIILYFGSFLRTFSHLSDDAFKAQLKKTLLHEFTHHIESLAGEKGLEIKDEEDYLKYLKQK